MLQTLVKDSQNGKGATATGSVGRVGVAAFDANNNRIKGIFTEVVHDRSGLSAVFSRVMETERENPSADRTTFRAFVNRELIEEIRAAQQLDNRERLVASDAHLEVDGLTAQFMESIRKAKDAIGIDLPYQMEAVIRTNGTVSGCDLVYFGRNRSGRIPQAGVREEEEAHLATALNANVVPEEKAYARLEGNSYRIETLNGNASEEDIATMLDLYKEAYQLYTFPINHDTIKAMLGNGNITYVARNEDGRIASMLIAEHAVLSLNDGSTVNLHELSDFATFKADRGNGLITALQIRAAADLRGMDPHSIIYAEDRAPWKAVNVSSKQAGFEYSGTLPLHCNLVSDRDVLYNGTLETLNVWSVPATPKEQ
ncbi:Beta-lysine N6-acetyltransferase [uncultured archaeon]|nr:Beta-lysine N6-acetyltransferase [uncultured archaeon]